MRETKCLLDSSSDELETSGDVLDEKMQSDFDDGYQDNPNLPVYRCGKEPFTSREVFKILTDPPHDKICSQKPTNVCDDVAFIVDLQKLNDEKDLTADGHGTYIQHGVPPEHCYIGTDGDFIISRHTLDTEELEIRGLENLAQVEHCLLSRQYAKLKASLDFQRIIMKLVIPKHGSRDADTHRYCLVQYRFTGKVHQLPTVVHGNSKKRTQSFHSTQHSTRQIIREASQDETRAKTLMKIGQRSGGFLHAHSSTELPRNAKQISNFRSKVSSNQVLLQPLIAEKDSLLAVIEECKATTKGQFVREVSAAPEPTCILATNQQLVDLQRFCCAPHPSNSILGVDPTFNLGEFYVTCTVFRHSSLHNKNGNFCLFHGPMFIHQRKQYETYHQFASALVRLAPPLRNMKAIGTDGEKALYTAFLAVFNDADHLRCTVHMRKNIHEKLKSLSLPSRVSLEFLNDIFGHVEGATHNQGLIDCASDDDAVLDSLRSVWNNRESPFTPRNSEPQFHRWFIDSKAQDFKECMLPDIRSRNGLGNPPVYFTTNDNEAANKVVKDEVGYRKSQLTDFIQKMKAMVDTQQERVTEAIVGSGDHTLANEFQQFYKGQDWWVMTEKQRKAHLTKVNKHVPGQPHLSTTPPQSKGMNNAANLSLSAENSGIASVPMPVLQKIFKRASSILGEGRVIAVPRKEDEFLVSSDSRSYIVSRKSKGAMHCDKKTCSSFGMFGICSHCVAAAEHKGCLASCISFFKKTHPGSSVSQASMFDMPAGAGTKDGKGKSKKKKKKNEDVIDFAAIRDKYRAESISTQCEPSNGHFTQTTFGILSSATPGQTSSGQFSQTTSGVLPSATSTPVPTSNGQFSQTTPGPAILPSVTPVLTSNEQFSQTTPAVLPSATSTPVPTSNGQFSQTIPGPAILPSATPVLTSNEHGQFSQTTPAVLPSAAPVTSILSGQFSRTTSGVLPSAPVPTHIGEHSCSQPLPGISSVHTLGPISSMAMATSSTLAPGHSTTTGQHSCSQLLAMAGTSSTLAPVPVSTGHLNLSTTSSSSIPLAPLGTKFWIKPLSNRIKKCAGCGGPFIHEACANVCVATIDYFQLTFSSGRTVSKESTIHFHPFESCIRRKFQSFDQGLIVCNVTLNSDQRRKLQRSLKWNI